MNREFPIQMAGVPIAEKILKDCGFEETERTEMLTAIARSSETKTAAAEKNLNGLIYRADKLSRSCFACPVEKECDWIAEKKESPDQILKNQRKDARNEDRKQSF